MTEYVLRAQSGRTVMTFCSEDTARAKQLEMASRGVALKLVRVTRVEEELA